MKELTSFTVSPGNEKLAGILGMLRSYPDILLVLNHPLMDAKGIGLVNTRKLLGGFSGLSEPRLTGWR
jgi:hypothetical protein